MLVFLLGLLFKIVLTAGIVVAASVVVERSGGRPYCDLFASYET
jgi:hypothetical protein